MKSELSGDRLIATLKKEKAELDSELNKEKSENQRLKQELAGAENRNADLYKVIVCGGSITFIHFFMLPFPFYSVFS